MRRIEYHAVEGTPNSLTDGWGLGAQTDESRQPSVNHAEIDVLVVLSDVAMILLASLLSSTIYHLQAVQSAASSWEDAGFGLVVAGVFVLWMKSRGMYDPAGRPTLRRQIFDACIVWTGTFMLLAGAMLAMHVADVFSWRAILLFATVGLLALVARRILWMQVWRKAAHAKPAGRKGILLSDHTQANMSGVPEALALLGFRLEHHFVLPPESHGARRCEEIISLVIAYARRFSVDGILVAVDPRHWDNLRGPIDALKVLPFPVYLIPTGPAADIFSRRVCLMGNNVCVELQRSPLSLLERAVKRGIDIVLSALALVLFLPLLLGVMCAIKLESPGPILFRQARHGFNGRTFQILKFRTMTVMEDGVSIQQASKSDPRVTRVGKWLRRASIDELPQLLNVLKGSMSLVGPRPHAIAHDVEFDRLVRNYAFRQRMKPGLTGWAQVHGFRGPTPNVESIKGRVERDTWYIDHWSVWLDLYITLMTVIEVVRGRNAH